MSPGIGRWQCTLCDGCIHITSPLDFNTERPEWKTRESATCSTEDLQNMYFQMPWLWSSFARVVIETTDPANGRHASRFQLSGVSQMGDWQKKSPVSVPRNKNTVHVGRFPNNGDETWDVLLAPLLDDYEHYEPHYYGNPVPVGNLFHERCWTLTQRVIGSSRVKDNLDLLMGAMFQIKPFPRLFIRARSHFTGGEISGLLYSPGLFIHSFSGLVPSYPFEEVTAIRTTPAGCRRDDPLNIIELRDLISEAIQRRLNFSAITTNTTNKTISYQNIPVELLEMIMKYLDTDSDIRNALAVFDWHLPDKFWHARFPREVVIEYEDLMDSNLDWQYLYLGVYDLLETSRGLRRRKEIIGVLDRLREVFDKLVQRRQDQSPAVAVAA